MKVRYFLLFAGFLVLGELSPGVIGYPAQFLDSPKEAEEAVSITNGGSESETPEPSEDEAEAESESESGESNPHSPQSDANKNGRSELALMLPEFFRFVESIILIMSNAIAKSNQNCDATDFQFQYPLPTGQQDPLSPPSFPVNAASSKNPNSVFQQLFPSSGTSSHPFDNQFGSRASKSGNEEHKPLITGSIYESGQLKSLTAAKHLNKNCVFQGVSALTPNDCQKYLICFPTKFNRFEAFLAECPEDKKFSTVYRRCVQPYMVPECSGFWFLRQKQHLAKDKNLEKVKDDSNRRQQISSYKKPMKDLVEILPGNGDKPNLLSMKDDPFSKLTEQLDKTNLFYEDPAQEQEQLGSSISAFAETTTMNPQNHYQSMDSVQFDQEIGVESPSFQTTTSEIEKISDEYANTNQAESPVEASHNNLYEGSSTISPIPYQSSSSEKDGNRKSEAIYELNPTGESNEKIPTQIGNLQEISPSELELESPFDHLQTFDKQDISPIPTGESYENQPTKFPSVPTINDKHKGNVGEITSETIYSSTAAGGDRNDGAYLSESSPPKFPQQTTFYPHHDYYDYPISIGTPIKTTPYKFPPE